METKYQTIKIYKKTLSTIRLISAMREQPIVKVLDDLVQKELDRLRRIRDKA